MTNILITGYNVSFKQNETNIHDFEDCKDYMKVRSSKWHSPIPKYLHTKTPKTVCDEETSIN